MAFTYNSSNLGSSELSQVRRLINDASSASMEYNDAEINFFIDEEANIYGAASAACQGLAAKYALVVDKSVGDLRLSAQQKYEHYKGLATDYKVKSELKGSPQVYAGGISVADKDTKEADTDRVEPTFTVGMHDFDGTSINSTRS